MNSYFILEDFIWYIFSTIMLIVIVALCILKTYKSHLSNFKKKLLLGTLTSITFFILIFVGFEAYFRYIYDIADGMTNLKIMKMWAKKHVSINNFGVRDKIFNQRKETDTTRICVIGDSMSYAAGIKNVNNRYSNLLESTLQKKGIKSEVYNFAMPGHETITQLKMYKNTIKNFSCDIVIWQYYFNDIHQEIPIKVNQSQVVRFSVPPTLQLLMNHSYFVDFVYWKWWMRFMYQPVGKNTNKNSLLLNEESWYKDPQLLNQHIKDIKELSSLILETSDLILIVFPPLDFPLSKYWGQDIYENMLNIFNEAKIQTIDLLPFIKGKKVDQLIVSPNDWHPNEYVHSVAAKLLYEKILPLLNNK